MLEDIRNHNPALTAQESERIATGGGSRERVPCRRHARSRTTASWLCDYQADSASFVVTSAPPAR
jgi:hypothetical protein